MDSSLSPVSFVGTRGIGGGRFDNSIVEVRKLQVAADAESTVVECGVPGARKCVRRTDTLLSAIAFWTLSVYRMSTSKSVNQQDYYPSVPRRACPSIRRSNEDLTGHYPA